MQPSENLFCISLIHKKVILLHAYNANQDNNNMAKNEENNQNLHLDEALIASGSFIEKHKKTIIIGLSAVILLVLGIIGYQQFVKKPRVLEAANHLSLVQQAFEMRNDSIALYGDGNENIGAVAIMEEYGSTPSGKVARLYAGISSYRLGNYQDAIDFLEDYKADDLHSYARSRVTLGDAYANLGQLDEAAEAFKDGVDSKSDVFAPVCLKKLGAIYEAQGKAEEAIKAYEQIKSQYPQSVVAEDIDKYIAYLK